MTEHEIKLPFADIEAARQAVRTAGGRLDVSLRLIDDRLFDTGALHLRGAGTALRVRRDGTRGFLTFKGPVQPGPIKSREELETAVGAASTAEAVLAALGYRCYFRSQKYREEYIIGATRLMVDDAPCGVFVEIEGLPDQIARIASLMGKTAADYVLESYPALWRRWCETRGLPPSDMLIHPTSADEPASIGAAVP